MGISLDSLSITSAFNSILSFFKSQENNSRWKDLSTGSEGTFLIRMLANILSNISYRLVTARRENYLSTANLKSSALGIALNLGYSANRGSNQKRKIQFEPNSDYVIPSHTVIGAYNSDYDIIYIGEQDATTKLRNGLVLRGPYILTSVNSIQALSNTIVLSEDVAYDLAVGDTIDITDTSDSENNNRYTVKAIATKQVSTTNVYTYITVNEDIPKNSHGGFATKVGIQEFKTVIGKLKTITWTAGTSKTQPFTRFEEGISEDYILFLDGEEVPSSNIIKDMYEDTYLVRTNPYSSVDVLYLNHITTNKYRYGSESVFTLKYVELADVDTIAYDEQITLGKVLNTLTIDNYIPFETNSDIKINAPLDHEVQHLIRSKRDYTQRVKQSLPNIIETSYQAITPTYTLISYLKDDCTLVKQTEIDELNKILDNENYFGTPLPDITPPIRETINLNIQLFVTDKMKDSNDIRYDINNIVKNNFSTVLNQTFDVYILERLLESLSYVKWARVSYDINDWTPRSTIDLGTLISVEDTYYKATKILGISGGLEPAWNIPVTNTPLGINLDAVYETVDGNIIWRAYKRLDVSNIKRYTPDTKYSLGDYVYTETYPNFMFKVVDLVKNSGSTSSLDTSTTFEGDFLLDGDLVLVCKAENDSYPTRYPNTAYRLGSSFNVNNKSFEVVSYVGKTGYKSPAFEKASFSITNKVTPDIIKDFSINIPCNFKVAGNKTQFYNNGSIVTATKDNGYSVNYTVRQCVYDANSDMSTIWVEEKIDIYSVPIQSTAIENALTYFILSGDKEEHFTIGDNVRATGVYNDSGAETSINYVVADIIVKTSEGDKTTWVGVKSAIPSTITLNTLIAEGFTALSGKLNNAFVLEEPLQGSDLTSLFPAGSVARAKTDEDTEMTYRILSSEYDTANKQTIVRVKQDISSIINYTDLLPSWTGTEDGEIVWSIVQDIDNFTYDWNVYNDIMYTSNIRY